MDKLKWAKQYNDEHPLMEVEMVKKNGESVVVYGSVADGDFVMNVVCPDGHLDQPLSPFSSGYDYCPQCDAAQGELVLGVNVGVDPR